MDWKLSGLSLGLRLEGKAGGPAEEKEGTGWKPVLTWGRSVSRLTGGRWGWRGGEGPGRMLRQGKKKAREDSGASQVRKKTALRPGVAVKLLMCAGMRAGEERGRGIDEGVVKGGRGQSRDAGIFNWGEGRDGFDGEATERE